MKVNIAFLIVELRCALLLSLPLLNSPGNSSEFCRNSARSLVAAFNDGALPCNCHRKGATSPTCNPEGGQCDCRPHIIGRQCSRCQTGFYGFPFCKRK